MEIRKKRLRQMVRGGLGRLLTGGAICLVLLSAWQVYLNIRLNANEKVIFSVDEAGGHSSSSRANFSPSGDNGKEEGGAVSKAVDLVRSWSDEQQSRRDQIYNVCKVLRKQQHARDIEKNTKSGGRKKKSGPSTRKGELLHLSHSRQALSYLYVDDVHKLIYCNVPKVSSTQWKNVLILLSNSKYNSTDDISYRTTHFTNNLNTLSKRKYSSQDVQYRLESYSKVLTIRDPLERLLSAYRDKFAEDAPLTELYNNMFGKHWISVVRKNKTQTGILQFSEMLEYLARHSGPTGKFNGHWRPIFDLCHPCIVQYDFVSNFTTQEQDGNEILNRVLKGSEKKDLRFPAVKVSSTGEALKQILPTLDPELVKDVQRVYYKDYEMFGYQRLTWTEKKEL